MHDVNKMRKTSPFTYLKQILFSDTVGILPPKLPKSTGFLAHCMRAQPFWCDIVIDYSGTICVMISWPNNFIQYQPISFQYP